MKPCINDEQREAIIHAAMRRVAKRQGAGIVFLMGDEDNRVAVQWDHARRFLQWCAIGQGLHQGFIASNIIAGIFCVADMALNIGYPLNLLAFEFWWFGCWCGLASVAINLPISKEWLRPTNHLAICLDLSRELAPHRIYIEDSPDCMRFIPIEDDGSEQG